MAGADVLRAVVCGASSWGSPAWLRGRARPQTLAPLTRVGLRVTQGHPAVPVPAPLHTAPAWLPQDRTVRNEPALSGTPGPQCAPRFICGCGELTAVSVVLKMRGFSGPPAWAHSPHAHLSPRSALSLTTPDRTECDSETGLLWTPQSPGRPSDKASSRAGPVSGVPSAGFLQRFSPFLGQCSPPPRTPSAQRLPRTWPPPSSGQGTEPLSSGCPPQLPAKPLAGPEEETKAE